MKLNLKRVSFILTAFLGVFAVAEAQQPAKIPHIAFLGGSSAAAYYSFVDALKKGLHQLAMLMGKTLRLSTSTATAILIGFRSLLLSWPKLEFM